MSLVSAKEKVRASADNLTQVIANVLRLFLMPLVVMAKRNQRKMINPMKQRQLPKVKIQNKKQKHRKQETLTISKQAETQNQRTEIKQQERTEIKQQYPPQAQQQGNLVNKHQHNQHQQELSPLEKPPALPSQQVLQPKTRAT